MTYMKIIPIHNYDDECLAKKSASIWNELNNVFDRQDDYSSRHIIILYVKLKVSPKSQNG